MRRTEGVVDEQVRERSQPPREVGVVLLLAGVEPQVLQQQHAAGPELAGRALHLGPHAVGRVLDAPTEQLAEPDSYGLEAQRLNDFARRSAEVRA